MNDTEYIVSAYQLNAHEDEFVIFDCSFNETPKRSKKLRKLLNTICKKGGAWQLRIYQDGDKVKGEDYWEKILKDHRTKGTKLRIFPEATIAPDGIYYFVYPVPIINPRLQVETAPRVISL